MTRRTLPGALAAMVLALGLGVLAAPSASAHDQQVSTDPADGSTVATVPDHVTVTLEEPAVALGTVIQVTGPDGSVVSSGDPQLVNSDVVEAITAKDLPAGKYAVEWRVTSPDGHAVSGSFSFTAAQGSGGAGASATPTTSSAATTAGQTPVATAASAASDSGNGSVVWVIVGVGVLVGIALGLLGWFRARRRASAPGGPPSAGPGA